MLCVHAAEFSEFILFLPKNTHIIDDHRVIVSPKITTVN